MHPIRDERVTVEIRLERIGRDAPDALLVFLHRHGGDALACELTLLGVRIAEAESYAVVRMHFRRDDRRRGLRRLSRTRLRRLRPSRDNPEDDAERQENFWETLRGSHGVFNLE